MKNDAALGAYGDDYRIIFSSKEHKDFFYGILYKIQKYDVYHQALFYCLGIDRDTRDHIESIYDFEEDTIKTECLTEGWITSGSSKIVRMAFNLYCGDSPSVDDQENKEDMMTEYECYTPEYLFCCGYAMYFWQAIKLRYPEYCE